MQAFSIKEKLGEGGFGKVMRAVNRVSGEEVAMKFLKMAGMGTS